MNLTDLPASIANRITVAPSGCWEWTGTLTEKGYGHIWWEGKTRRVHRVVWELLVGPIPEGMELHHRCENEPCCRPACLEVCTTLYNVNQKPDVNKAWCVRNHLMTPENTRVQVRADGIHRSCKTCTRERKAAKRAAA